MNYNIVADRLNLRFILKILVAIVLLSWFLYKSDVNKIFENIYNLPLKILLSAVILDFIYLFIKSFRWQLLLPQYSIRQLVELSFISQFYSLISAGQFVGEAAKIYILGKGKKDAGQITMSVLIDKITGIIGLIIVAIFGLFFTPTILPKSLTWTFIVSAILCLVLIFSIRLPFIYNLLFKFLNSRLNKSIRLKKIFNSAINLLAAWHVYSKKIKYIFISIVLSVIFQLVLVGVYMILSYGFGISISFLDWCWLLGFITVLLVLPITIGGIGVREGSLVGLLGFFMITPEKALALSFSIFGLQLVFAAIGGIIEIKRTGLLNFKTKEI